MIVRVGCDVCVSGWCGAALLFSLQYALVGCDGMQHLPTGDQESTAASGRRRSSLSAGQITHAEVRMHAHTHVKVMDEAEVVC